MTAKKITLDGNQAAAHIAHKTNEVIAIYPITPASPMGEFSDEWSAQGKKNIWGGIPEIIEMQSEGGASGAVHGAVQAGALTTTFTASQGLLLMIPNMYKIAGELSPVVIHVAARSLAAQALSIFGDHSDVMATRATGFAMLASGSVQEAMDMALISQASTLCGHLPFVHFFDGFRTSHELMKVDLVDDEVIRSMIENDYLVEHRASALTPDKPVLRGTSQNPDVYFQGRETVNPYYEALPEVVQKCMDQFAGLTGRQYHLFDYFGATDAERVVVLMGSGAEAVEETVEDMLTQGEKVGLLRVRLYRPFSTRHLFEALPATVKGIAVLDRCKEPGAGGEPLYKDVVTAFAEHVATGGGKFSSLPLILGGRYGLSSKEFTPGMIRAVFGNLAADNPKNQFTIGIHDDVSHTSLEWDKGVRNADMQGVIQCLFYGLGSDGTVSANKNTPKTRLKAPMECSMKKLLVLFLLCLFSAGLLAADPKEGTDYDLISPAPPKGSGNEVEVLEFFMYTCPHCKNLDPKLQEWAKKLPENVKFHHMPAMFGGSANLHAKTYFALEVMGEAKRLHKPFFKAIHEQKRRLRNQKDIEKFLAENDVDLDKFRAAMKSFTVQTKANRAAALMRRYGIRSVPSMVVDGRYRIKNTPTVLETTDMLIEKTIADRK